MNQVDINDGTPLYQQVAEQLMLYIHEHSLNPGQRLPSEKELSDTYGVSRITVRKALELLSGQHRRKAARQGDVCRLHDADAAKYEGRPLQLYGNMPQQRNRTVHESAGA